MTISQKDRERYLNLDPGCLDPDEWKAIFDSLDKAEALALKRGFDLDMAEAALATSKARVAELTDVLHKILNASSWACQEWREENHHVEAAAILAKL